jgi:hypothetical protein
MSDNRPPPMSERPPGFDQDIMYQIPVMVLERL